MQVHRKDRTYKVARITGPTHNYLSLTFHQEFCDVEPQIELIPDATLKVVKALDLGKVRDFVLEGVSRALESAGYKLSVERIEYLPADSPPESIYRLLAKVITDQAIQDRLREAQAEKELKQAIQEKIEIRDYDPEWPLRFALEQERLKGICGDSLLEIEHVGSTAVPGLSAKPIIDIAASVSSMAEADRLLELLCANGYTTSREFNATLGDRRWLMRQQDGRRTHHLHLLLCDCEDWRKKIRFRDILRRDSKAREEYAELKRRLAAELGENREAYSEAKTDFVSMILRRESKERTL